MYVVLEACCTAWGIPLIPGKHLPQVSGTSTLSSLFLSGKNIHLEN
jgi:hypothetical protein